MPRRATLIAGLVLILALIAIQYLRTPARPTIFTSLSFEDAQAAVEQASPPKLLVIDFGADWCPPCRQMDRTTWTSPSLTQWLTENAVTVKVDIDDDKARARSFGITAVPTVVVIKGRQEVARITGLRTAGQLLDQLKPLLNK